jgi:hypothetical protein
LNLRWPSLQASMATAEMIFSKGAILRNCECKHP